MLLANINIIASSSMFQTKVPCTRNATAMLKRNGPLDKPIVTRNNGQSTATVHFIITSRLLFDIGNRQTMLKINFMQFHSCKAFPLLILCFSFTYQIRRSASLQKQVVVLLLCKLKNRYGVHCETATWLSISNGALMPNERVISIFINLLSECAFGCFLNVWQCSWSYSEEITQTSHLPYFWASLGLPAQAHTNFWE